MKKYWFFAFLVSVLWFVTVSETFGTEDKIMAPYSPSEGDRWEFESNITGTAASSRGESSSAIMQGKYAAVYEKGGLIFLQILNEKEFLAHPNVAGQLVNLFSFTNNRGYYKFPMDLSSSWPVKYEYVPEGRKFASRVEGQSKVLSLKEVKTDVGRYTLAKIKMDGTLFPPTAAPLRMEINILYSTETGCAIQYNQDNNLDGKGAKAEVKLTKFIPGKPKADDSVARIN